MPVEPDSVSNKSTSQATSSSQGSGFPEFPSKAINKRIAVVSALAAVGLFLSGRLDFGVSLKDLAAVALPYEEVCQIHYTLRDFISIGMLLYNSGWFRFSM